MWRFVVLLSVVAAVRSQSTAVSQCISHAGELPINTYIEGCETPPCQLPQLQDAVINIIFRAPYTMRSMTTLATAYMYGFPIPYPLQAQAVTCNFLTNTYCPVLQDEVVQYTLNMYIDPLFPSGTSVTIEFRIVDDNSVPVVCIRLPITITPPVNNNVSLLNLIRSSIK